MSFLKLDFEDPAKDTIPFPSLDCSPLVETICSLPSSLDDTPSPHNYNNNDLYEPPILIRDAGQTQIDTGYIDDDDESQDDDGPGLPPPHYGKMLDRNKRPIGSKWLGPGTPNAGSCAMSVAMHKDESGLSRTDRIRAWSVKTLTQLATIEKQFADRGVTQPGMPCLLQLPLSTPPLASTSTRGYSKSRQEWISVPHAVHGRSSDQSASSSSSSSSSSSPERKRQCQDWHVDESDVPDHLKML